MKNHEPQSEEDEQSKVTKMPSLQEGGVKILTRGKKTELLGPSFEEEKK